MFDLIGGGLILSAVFIIGGAAGGSNEGDDIDSKSLALAVIMALVTGFVMTLQALVLKKGFTEYMFDPIQIVFDGNIPFGFCAMILFIIEQTTNQTFTLK